jgi:hypothetical protein
MNRKSAVRRGSVLFHLEHLEGRLAPAVVVQNYPGAPYNNPYGTKCPGVYQGVAPYTTPGGSQMEVVLDGLTPSNPSANFIATLKAKFGAPWVFTYANASPANLSLTVKSYAALANSAATVRGQAGGMVGANLDVACNYRPMLAAGQFVDWIQVVTTNDPANNIVTPAVSYVDFDDNNPNLPTYGRGYDQRGFMDVSARSNISDPITWQGEVYLAELTGANAITIYPDGITWGWSVQGRSDFLNTPQLTLTSSTNPAKVIVGKTNLTATFTLPTTCVNSPTGQVTFVDDTTKEVLGRAPITSDDSVTFKATLPNISFATDGNHTITATYDGDEFWYGTTASTVQQVTKLGAALNLNSSVNPLVAGQAVTFTAIVSANDSGAPTPTGTVDFYDGQTYLGTGTLNASGVASLATSSLSTGSHDITADYSGDDVFDPVVGSMTQEVDDSSQTTGGTIGDTVWLDLNGDGVQNTGEPGVGGVVVNLLDALGNTVASTTTDQDGQSQFNGVQPGTYSLEFIAPPGYQFPAQGGNLISGGGSTSYFTNQFNLAAGQAINLGAGLQTINGSGSSGTTVGGYAWLDSNGDNTQESGEAGMTNVPVTLFDAQGTVVSTTTTDTNGYYQFTGLQPGNYSVQFVPPDGYDTPFLVDETSSFTVLSSMATESVGAAMQPSSTSPAGGSGPINVSGSVWLDLNGSGIEQRNDPGIDDVTVRLLDQNGAVVAMAITQGGSYSFAGLLPGTYSIQFILPPGYQFTAEGQGTDPTLASDVDPSTGFSAPFTLTLDQSSIRINAGAVS